MAADVVAVLDQLDVDKAVLVGNSIGGMIAMQTNLDAPERVIGNLILSSGTNIGADTPPEVAEAMQQDWKGVFSALLDSAIAADSKANKPEIATFMDGCFRCEDNFTEAVFFASLADPNGVFAWNITDRLAEINKPTLVIAGRQDGATTVEHNQLLADKIPGAEIQIYDHVAHFCQLEDPKLFNEQLTKFLQKVA
jgi:pimeloyl-ACP methyl ester carboxylesterase